LLAEAHSLASTTGKNEIASEHRFIDERQADIRGVVWGRQHLHVMDEVHKNLAQYGALAARRVCKVFQRGRIALPDSIFEQLLLGLNDGASREANAMRVVETMRPYYASLSAGQEFATAVLWGNLGFKGLSQTVVARMLHEMAHADRCGPDPSQSK
jgi:hypothetical protein